MVTIGAEMPAFVEAIRQINEAAFGRPNEGALVDTLRQGDSFIPELSLVAELDGQLVGHILFSKVQIQGEATTHEALALGPMAVLPQYQKQGVGSRLVTEGLAACERLGYPVVIVLGHPWFYPRFGFRPASPHGITPTFKVRDEVFMVYASEEEHLKQISGTVIYDPAFANV